MNRVMERKAIDVLTKKARAMMKDAKFPLDSGLKLYGQRRIYTPEHLAELLRRLREPLKPSNPGPNRSRKPSKELQKNDVDKPPLHHLRRFGCIAQKLILKDLRVDTKMGGAPSDV